MSLCIVVPCLNIDPCTLQANYTSVTLFHNAGRPFVSICTGDTEKPNDGPCVIEDWCPLTACLEAIAHQTLAQGKEAVAVIWL